MKKPFVFFLIVTMLFISASVIKVMAQRTIHFANVDWYVKSGGPMGPGPNYWSNSENSVWLDDDGRLHLAIRYVNGTWYCSEIYTHDFSTYGEHRFLVDGYIDRMDKNIVLGLFTYANDNAEIDIEYAKWGYANNEEMGSFTIQPGSREGNSYSFKSPLTDSKTTHFFDWQPGYVLFANMYGHHSAAPPSPNDYIAQWVYTGADIPAASENLRVHINFWLFNGSIPVDQSVLEVIIDDIKQPLSAGLNEEGPQGVIKQFELQQNFPNPFNSKTTIGYELSDVRGINLNVINVHGQVVTNLVSKKQPAGEYQVPFDASGLSAGVYFYRLQVDGGQQVKKMIYLP